MNLFSKHLTDFLRKYKTHIISWGVFITYEIAVVGMIAGLFADFWDYFVHYAINISLFYLHATVILPLALQRQKPLYWLIPLLVLAEILSYLAVTYTVEHIATTYFGLQLTRPLEFNYVYITRSVWRAVYFMGFATGYYYFVVSLKEKRRAEFAEKQHLINIIEQQKLQNELVKSQHAFLKAQINPHFLFNTLNFVYNNVRKTSAQAAETVMSLSHMMRYALQSEDEHQETDLLEEIEHVENLIHIHQIRHDHQLQIQLTYGDNLAGVKIIPLALATLVENIFQHGDLSNRRHPAEVNIILEDNTLSITTANLMHASYREGHGIGLKNIQARLQIAYKGAASLKAHSDERGYFHTALMVPSSLISNTPFTVLDNVHQPVLAV